MGRPVTVFEMINITGTSKWERVEKCRGTFHEWGCGYEEFETGPGNYSVGIVELEDGTIITPASDFLQFEDSPPL